jgi:hypothetical protein
VSFLRLVAGLLDVTVERTDGSENQGSPGRRDR